MQLLLIANEVATYPIKALSKIKNDQYLGYNWAKKWALTHKY